MSARELCDRDLQDLTPGQFEQLTFLLARADDERTLIVRNHDRGLDARLPDPMGRLTLRGWQAKRFATGAVQWSQCESSIKTAIAFWRPLWITFVFAHDLSASEQETFRTRLVEAFPIVRLSYWSAAEVLRRMRDTDDGRRATAWLFERPGTIDELLATLVDKEPVSGAKAIAERQAALNRQFERDPHLYYTAVVRPAGAPETPPSSATVASVIFVMDGQQVRYDLSERYPGAFGDSGGGPALVARDNERGRATERALDAAAGSTGPLIIEGGSGMVWSRVPVGLRGLFPEDPRSESSTNDETSQDLHPDADGPLSMLVKSGEAELGLTFVPAPEVDAGWDVTLVGATGGLELTQSLRASVAGVDGVQMRWRHTLGVGPATEQLLSAQVLLAGLEGGEILLVVGDGSRGPKGHATVTIDDHDFDDAAIADLRVHIEFLTYVCEVQAWLGVPLFPPARPSRRDTAELGRALAHVREPMREGTWSSITVVEHEEVPSLDGGDVAILQPIFIELFGSRYYLGMELLQVKDVRLDRSHGETQLRPRGMDTIWAQLHHPSDLPAEAASKHVGEGRGRVLVRDSTKGGELNDMSVT